MNKRFASPFTKILACIACMLATTASKAQTIKNGQIVMGVVDSVYSKVLGENRKLWVYTPAGMNDSFYASKHYPVVYLMDGDLNFPSVTGMIQMLSEMWGNDNIPEMIVVGIPNTNRLLDLTPTVDTSRIKLPTGGGEKFTQFIKTELMPHIDSTYPTAPYKMLIGHSLGGLMVVNTFINHADMFNAYIAVDPSMWWDNQKLLNQARQVLRHTNYANKWLFLGIANTMLPGMDTAQVRKDTAELTRHIRDILLLKDMLKNTQRATGINFDYGYYHHDTHTTSPLITEYTALRFFFNYYAIDDYIETKMEANKLDSNIIKYIQNHYDNVSKKMGYKVYPSEAVVNETGVYFLQKQPKLAFDLFTMNIKNYPTSYNVYDSMGEYYASIKDNTKAIEYYKKALSIRQFPQTKEKLDKLLGSK